MLASFIYFLCEGPPSFLLRHVVSRRYFFFYDYRASPHIFLFLLGNSMNGWLECPPNPFQLLSLSLLLKANLRTSRSRLCSIFNGDSGGGSERATVGRQDRPSYLLSALLVIVTGRGTITDLFAIIGTIIEQSSAFCAYLTSAAIATVRCTGLSNSPTTPHSVQGRAA